MKILYYSDNYTFDIFGTKRSIFEETNNRGHQLVWVDKQEIHKIVERCNQEKPDQIWLAHSNLTLTPEQKAQLTLPVIGFGFSDPYYFSTTRFESYDAYITNHDHTLRQYNAQLPIHYNPTACDFRFHKDLKLEKDLQISLIGLGTHPRFTQKDYRIHVVNKLREDGFQVHTFGRHWPEHKDNHPFISGTKFLEIINRSILGLDLQDTFSPLAHRMFEYAACKVPVITRRRSEVLSMFEDQKEIITYETLDELRKILRHYLDPAHQADLRQIGVRAEERCRKEHNISFRIDKLIKFISELKLSA